LVDFEEDR
jgi:hypothetical protein